MHCAETLGFQVPCLYGAFLTERLSAPLLRLQADGGSAFVLCLVWGRTEIAKGVNGAHLSIVCASPNSTRVLVEVQ